MYSIAYYNHFKAVKEFIILIALFLFASINLYAAVPIMHLYLAEDWSARFEKTELLTSSKDISRLSEEQEFREDK